MENFNNVDEIIKLKKQNEELEKRINHLEFRQSLILDKSNTTSLLLDYDITQSQYKKIMDIMDEYRKEIGQKKEVNHSSFETKILDAVDNREDMDYHFCEYIAMAFMKDRRWEEVFPKLYGDMQKYKYLLEKE